MSEPTPIPRMQCRYIKSSGHPCRGLALRGQLYCFTHGRDHRRSHISARMPTRIEIPRLDNRDDIQQVLTDLARAIAAETIDQGVARMLIAVVRLASRQLPPPIDLDADRRQLDKEEGNPEPEPLEEVIIGPEGEELAPETPYRDWIKPKRAWSFAEYLYYQGHPEERGNPLPEEGYGNLLQKAGERWDAEAAQQLTNPHPQPPRDEWWMKKPEPPATTEPNVESSTNAQPWTTKEPPATEELLAIQEPSAKKEDPPTLILDNLYSAAEPQQYRSTTQANCYTRMSIHHLTPKYSQILRI